MSVETPAKAKVKIVVGFDTEALSDLFQETLAKPLLVKKTFGNRPHITQWLIFDSLPILEINTRDRQIKVPNYKSRYYYENTNFNTNKIDVGDGDRPYFDFVRDYSERAVNRVVKAKAKQLLGARFPHTGLTVSSRSINFYTYDTKLKYAMFNIINETDPEIYDLAEQIFGKHMTKSSGEAITLGMLNFVWANKEGIQEVLAKLPVAHAWFYQLYKRYRPSFYNSMTNTDVMNFKRDNLMQDMINLLKERLEIKNNPGLWRYVAKMTKNQGWQLERHGLHEFPPEIFFDFFRQYGKMPKVTACNALSSWWCYSNKNALASRLLVSAFEASLKAANIKEWVENEWVSILDWWNADGKFRVPDPNQAKAGWKWFQKQSAVWHRHVVDEARVGHYTKEEKAKLEAKDTWTSLVAAIQIPERNAIAIPLNSRKALEEEGKSMRHCVGIYANKCLTEPAVSRLFSIRKLDTGERLATCQICRESESGKWHLEQIRGLDDHVVAPYVREIGHVIAYQYAEAQKKADAEERARLEAIKKAKEEAEKAAKKAEEEKRRLEEAKLKEGAKGLAARSEVIFEIPEHLRHIVEADTKPTDEGFTEEAKAAYRRGEYGRNDNVDPAQLVRDL